MRRIFITIMLASAPLALAACGEKAAETEDTIVAEETVIEEPAVDATAPAADNVVDEESTDAAADGSTEAGVAGEASETTEAGSEEK